MFDNTYAEITPELAEQRDTFLAYQAGFSDEASHA
jgi:hypothetical protein